MQRPNIKILWMAVGVLAGALTMAHAETYKDYETPDYVVQRAAGPFELRQYQPQLVAETKATGTRSAAAGRGFRTLAGYIFGGNQTGTEIAMTAPVTQVPAQNGYVVRFSMPKGYDLDSLPKPESAKVRLTHVSPGRQAVFRFTGRWTKGRLTNAEKQLTDWVQDQGLHVTGPVHYYFYDDPFTVPWKRRNEVAVPIAP